MDLGSEDPCMRLCDLIAHRKNLLRTVVKQKEKMPAGKQLKHVLKVRHIVKA